MVSNYFASHKGGIEIVAGELFQKLAMHRNEVVWLAVDATSPPEPVGNSHAVPVPASNFVEARTGIPFPIPVKDAISRIIREVKQADILVLHDCLYLSNMLAFLIAGLNGKPTVIIQHIGAFTSKKAIVNLIFNAGTRVVTRPMLSNASQVVFISETTRKYFTRLKFKNPPRVIFNGVNSDDFRMRLKSEPIAAIRRQYDLDAQSVVIIFVGRFVEKKGMAVMKIMAEQRPDWTWVFAGWGHLDPTNWSVPNVRVFSHLRGSSIAPLYRASDLLVLPSTGEGFPLVVQEALASGLPIVCGEETRQADPNLGSLVKGVPVFPGDDERTATGFLAAIDSSLTSAEVNSMKAAESRRDFAVRNYSWDHAIKQYLEIISRLVPKGESVFLESD